MTAADRALIEEAATYLIRRGRAETGDDGYLPDELVAELILVAAAGTRQCCRGPLNGSTLADHWETDRQEEWERSLPAWHCDCGARYKRIREGTSTRFYRVTRDGLLGPLAGTVTRNSKGLVKHSDQCYRCGRGFGPTVDDQAAGRTTLFLSGGRSRARSARYTRPMNRADPRMSTVIIATAARVCADTAG